MKIQGRVGNTNLPVICGRGALEPRHYKIAIYILVFTSASKTKTGLVHDNTVSGLQFGTDIRMPPL